MQAKNTKTTDTDDDDGIEITRHDHSSAHDCAGCGFPHITQYSLGECEIPKRCGKCFVNRLMDRLEQGELAVREPDDGSEWEHYSFSMRVVRELAKQGEWGAIHYTAENATGMGGLGPSELKYEIEASEDIEDAEPERVIEEILRGYNDHERDCEAMGASGYGPDDDGDGEGEEYPSKPDDAVDGHYRRNEGQDYMSQTSPGHRIHAEIDRLEQAGAVVQDYRVVETADDIHPDYLEIKYGGVSADEIERHRYRHIDSTQYYGVATRPLSEIAARDQEVSGDV